MKRYPVKASAAVDWSRATLLQDFSFPWEATPPPKTAFRALSAAGRLHFRFDCDDDDLVLGAGETKKQRVLGSDRVELFFTRDLSLEPYFCLEMAPSGEAYGYRARSYRKFDDDFQWPGLELATSVAEGSYVVRGSLPLSALRELGVLAPCARELRVGAYRAEFSHLESGGIHHGWMSWVEPDSEQPDFHVPSSFGVFELLD